MTNHRITRQGVIRPSGTGVVIGTLIGVVLVLAALIAIAGWAFMIAIGILASAGAVSSTIGFGDAVLVAVLLRIALSLGNANVSKS